MLAFLFFEFGKEADVATYLDLISSTDQGIRKVTDSPEGAKAESAAENLASRSSGGIHDLAQHQRQKASGRWAELASVQAAYEQERREGPMKRFMCVLAVLVLSLPMLALAAAAAEVL